MRGREVRGALRAWLPLAVASTVAAIAAWIFNGLYSSPHPQRPVDETAWQWNTGARITLCLSMKGALGKDVLSAADLSIDGTLIGFGEMSHASDPRDTGNVVWCDNYPQRYVEVEDREGRTWRIMYDLPEQRYPAVRARVHSQVRFVFRSAFYSAQTARFVLSDEAGPVLGIEMNGHGPNLLEEGNVSLSWGRTLGRRPTGCGGEYLARAVQVSGDTSVSIPPGQVGSVSLHGAKYLFWNIHSLNVVDGGCLHDDDWSSWIVWRE